MARGENNGRSARVTGMSTRENVVSDCGLPSSTSWNSSRLRSRTKRPCWSRDDRVDFHVVHLGPEGDRGHLGVRQDLRGNGALRGNRRRRLLADDRRAEKSKNDQRRSGLYTVALTRRTRPACTCAVAEYSTGVSLVLTARETGRPVISCPVCAQAATRSNFLARGSVKL